MHQDEIGREMVGGDNIDVKERGQAVNKLNQLQISDSIREDLRVSAPHIADVCDISFKKKKRSYWEAPGGLSQLSVRLRLRS